MCGLALMLFPNANLGASEIYRVLRDGGRAAVSVETTAGRSLTTRINTAIGRHVPSRAAAASGYYALGHKHVLSSLLTKVGFLNIEVFAGSHRFPIPSFDSYFGPIEQGVGSVGTGFVSLSADLQRIVRDVGRHGKLTPRRQQELTPLIIEGGWNEGRRDGSFADR